MVLTPRLPALSHVAGWHLEVPGGSLVSKALHYNSEVTTGHLSSLTGCVCVCVFAAETGFHL